MQSKTEELIWDPGTKQDESNKWQWLSTKAMNAFDFWKTFLILKKGQNSDQELGTECIDNFLMIIRCVSWVESNHGTGSGSSSKDPMQCGNPSDAWWVQLVSQEEPVPDRERFVSGPGGSNYYAEELPGAAEPRQGFPTTAKIGNLNDKTDGHRDSKFNNTHSFYWGVPFLIQKINKIPSGATYKCGECSKDRMIDGAEAYNGGGVPDYRDRIERTWSMITS